MREAAVGSGGPAEFVELLTRAGYLVEVRRAPSGGLLGYKVARAGGVTATGEPVFYSGSKLAPDLSLPRLLRAWEVAGRARDVADPWSAAPRRVDAARRAIRAARRGQGVEDPDGLIHAAHSVATAMRGTSGEWTAAVDHYDRAARPPRGTALREGARAAGLRRVARQMMRQRRILGIPDEAGAAGVALALALSSLLREIAAWQRDRGRAHQADAALSAADALTPVSGGPGTLVIDGLLLPVSAAPGHRPRTQPSREHGVPARATTGARIERLGGR